MSDPTQDIIELNEWSVSTIRDYRDIEKAIFEDGFIEFIENVASTAAAKQLQKLDRDKSVLPVLLADSTSEQIGVMAWGTATKISITGTQTRVRLEDVQEIPARPVISSLWYNTTKERLSEDDQLNYRLVETPKFLFTDPKPKTFVLTWNPKNKVPMERFLETRQHLLDGFQVVGHWFCYSSNKVRAGDRFVMLRKGDIPRGIVGSGWIRSDGWKDDENIPCVNILWEHMVHPDQPLDPLSISGAESFHWAPQRSGIELDESFCELVWNAWENRISGESGLSSNPSTHPKPSLQEATIVSANTEEMTEDAASSTEGRLIESWSTRRERDPVNRARCLAIHKARRCAVCEMSFLEEFGEIGRDFIHVHHEHPLGANDDNTGNLHDPENAMKPVCPNCHAMLHRGMDARKGEVRSIAELRSIRSQARRCLNPEE